MEPIFMAGLVLLTFFCEYMDSSLGMGYGTTLTPVLLLAGFAPLAIVPCVLLSELITGLAAGFTHHSMGNVDFRPRTMSLPRIIRALREFGVKESFKRGVPQALKVVLVITACSVVGTVSAVVLAISLPKFYLKLYIGLLIFVIGVVILATMNRNFGFSWRKIGFLGVVASFNKGMSGGGYGPVVSGGQLMSGVDGKNAVAITSLAEGLTCVVGVLVYLLIRSDLDWSLAPFLVVGGILSVPFSGITVKKLNTRTLKLSIGVLTIVLGGFTLLKVLVL